jgi:hypothetical protein
MSAFVLTLSAVSAQSAPPSGAFGFLINASYGDPSKEYGLAILGVMNFDGAGILPGLILPKRAPAPSKARNP